MPLPTNKIKWIGIEPLDTLFFRGAESMVAGENHEVETLFPPMPQTIAGAIRTAVIGQMGITPAEYFKSPEQYPFLGLPEKPGFSMVGPLFLANRDVVLLPAPAHWHSAIPDDPPEELLVQAALPLNSSPLRLKCSTSSPFYVRHPIHDDLKSLAGWWVTPGTFSSMVANQARIPVIADASQLVSDEPALLPPTALYDREERLGIALTSRRTAREGHLYTTVHIRVRQGIELLAGIVSAHPVPLTDKGILQLGGEQRICRYRLCDDIAIPVNKQNSGLLMSLSPLAMKMLPATLEHCPRASGKLFRTGGWDMQKGFHKPMEAWLPQGAVFATNAAYTDNASFMAI